MAQKKSKLSDLALFGGSPLFDSIRITGQLFAPPKEELYKLLDEIYQRRRITNDGPIVCELEARLRDYHQVGEVVALTNACFAIMLCLRNYGGSERRTVLMPAFSYRGLPHLARWAGLEAGFVDVEPDFHTLCPESLKRTINTDTAAVLAVNNPNGICQIEQLSQLCEENNVPLLIDSVYGFGTSHGSRRLGGFGHCEVFSLHATKLLNGAEGGYITTDDQEFAALLRKQRNFGIESDGSISTLGLNAKLNEIHAAMALLSLDHAEDIIEGNRLRYEAYKASMRDLQKSVKLARYQDGSNHSLVLLEVLPESPLSRSVLIQLLRAENALVRPYYDPPLHELDRDYTSEPIQGDFPVTEKLKTRFIQLPVGELMSIDDIRQLGQFLTYIFNNASDIIGRLSRNDGKKAVYA